MPLRMENITPKDQVKFSTLQLAADAARGAKRIRFALNSLPETATLMLPRGVTREQLSNQVEVMYIAFQRLAKDQVEDVVKMIDDLEEL